MPIVKKNVRYVAVGYELCCGFERATALLNELDKQKIIGISSTEEDTRGWDGDRMAFVIVYYESLADANRLDAFVRKFLSRNVNFTYDPNPSISYSGRGPSAIFNPITTIEERS